MYFVKKNGVDHRLPDFMIPGAAKSGTTTLYQQLTAHPDIFFPKERKEPFYFSFGGEKPQYEDSQFNTIPVWDTQEYLDLYQPANQGQLCGDASTSYLYLHQASIGNMKKLYGDQLKDVKIIILLRNPINRAYSHYTYLIRNGYENRSFEEAISPQGIKEWKKKRWGFDYLQYGEYTAGVKAYFDEFNEVKVYLTEDLKNRDETLSSVCEFLGVSEMKDTRDVKANPSGIPKNKMLVDTLRKNKAFKVAGRLLPEKAKLKAQALRDNLMGKLLTKEPMNPATRNTLVDYFSDEIDRLEQTIERDLSRWKK